jgi:hypothetical protein
MQTRPCSTAARHVEANRVGRGCDALFQRPLASITKRLASDSSAATAPGSLATRTSPRNVQPVGCATEARASFRRFAAMTVLQNILSLLRNAVNGFGL